MGARACHQGAHMGDPAISSPDWTNWKDPEFADKNCTSLLDSGPDANQDNDDYHFLILGVLASLGGSSLNTGGTMLMKRAQMKNAELPPEQQFKQWNGIMVSPTWISGLFSMVAAVGFDLLAITLASQTVIAPLSGCNIVLTMIVGPKVLDGEEVRPVHWAAACVILCGTALAALFGPQASTVYDFAFLERRLTSWGVVVDLSCWVMSFVRPSIPHTTSTHARTYVLR